MRTRPEGAIRADSRPDIDFPAEKERRLVLSAHDAPTDEIRDELFSHIQRCGVLDATKEDREEWLSDTMDYLADRYPELSPFQIAEAETMGRRYLRPVIPHGAATHAANREEWQTDDQAHEPELVGAD